MCKRYLLNVVILVLASVVLFSGCGQPEKQPATAQKKAPAKGPRIEFEELVYDFGLIEPDTENVCEFNFKNTGQDTLHIEKVTKTCGCTPFSLEKRDYAPGEKGSLKVQYHASRGFGKIRKQLTVYTNDPENGSINLFVKANIIQKIVHKPERIDLSLREENAGCPDITLESTDDEPFSIESFHSRDGIITADFDPQEKKTRFVIEPKVDVEMLPKVWGGVIEIGVSHSKVNEIEIRIPFGTIREFKLTPPRIVYLKAEPGETTRRKVWVSNNYDESFEVESVSTEKGIMKVAGQKYIDQSSYEISLDITPPERKDGDEPFRDTLFIKLKNGGTLEVPCTGFY